MRIRAIHYSTPLPAQITDKQVVVFDIVFIVLRNSFLMNGGVFDTVYFKTLGHDNNNYRKAKEFVAYACKSAVVKSYPPALSHVAKNPYTHFVYPKPFQRKQDIQNTHLKDWIGIANKQLIIRHSTFNTISQEANFERKVRIFKSCVQANERAVDKTEKLNVKYNVKYNLLIINNIEVVPDTNQGL